MMKEVDHKLVTTLIADREKIAGWLRALDRDRQDDYHYPSSYKEAIEFLEKYRSRQVREFMQPILVEVINDIFFKLRELNVEPRAMTTHFQSLDPSFTGSARFTEVMTSPHLYSGKPKKKEETP